MELQAIYDRAKSFYGKAKVITENNGTIHLISYTTEVAIIKNGKLYIYGFYSVTTLRHIREFIRQYGFKNGSKAELEKMYC